MIAKSIECHQEKCDVVRSIVPLPAWEAVKQYRQAACTTNPISEQNLAFMVQEMKRRVYKGVEGILWDEMILKEEIVLFKRTGELAWCEDLTIWLWSKCRSK